MSQLDELILMAIGSGSQPFETELAGTIYEGIEPFTKDELKVKFKALFLELIGESYGDDWIEALRKKVQAL